MKLIKPDRLGFSRIESTQTSKERLAEYEAEGYRSVDDLEFELAKMVSRYNARRIIELVTRLFGEIEI